VWFDDDVISVFTDALLLIYGIFFLCGIYYCLRVFWCTAARMSELELEQLTLNVLLNLERVETKSEMLVQVYGDNVMKKTTVYKWAKHFSEGRESVTDEERSGRPATSRLKKTLQKFVKLCVKIVG